MSHLLVPCQVYILIKDLNLINQIPTLNDTKFLNKAYSLRNYIVHPGLGKPMEQIFTKEELWPFIKKLEFLNNELKQHYREMLEVGIPR
ncbi:MAG: hypothetical protein IPM48_07835 [Saprospiraceae bacterium]|nr:hypothetical protein [Saprospiraceae bacterium]